MNNVARRLIDGMGVVKSQMDVGDAYREPRQTYTTLVVDPMKWAQEELVSNSSRNSGFVNTVCECKCIEECIPKNYTRVDPAVERRNRTPEELGNISTFILCQGEFGKEGLDEMRNYANWHAEKAGLGADYFKIQKPVWERFDMKKVI